MCYSDFLARPTGQKSRRAVIDEGSTGCYFSYIVQHNVRVYSLAFNISQSYSPSTVLIIRIDRVKASSSTQVTA